MKFTIVFVSTVFVALGIVFTPVLGARDQVTLYADPYFGGESETFDDPISCVDITDKLQDDVSSIIIGVHLQCDIYALPECIGNSLGTLGPGSHPTLGANNDRIASFLCRHIDN